MYTKNQQKQIEQAAINNTVKDWGTKGCDKAGNPKQGYHRLKDGRVVKVADLIGKTEPAATNDDTTTNNDVAQPLVYDVETEAAKYPNLKNLRGLGVDTDGNLREGYIELQSGKVILKRHLDKEVLHNLEVQQ